MCLRERPTRSLREAATTVRAAAPACVAPHCHASAPVVEGRPRPCRRAAEAARLSTDPRSFPPYTSKLAGKVTFPPQYPYKPPSILMLTPNGRFATNTKLCLRRVCGLLAGLAAGAAAACLLGRTASSLAFLCPPPLLTSCSMSDFHPE